MKRSIEASTTVRVPYERAQEVLSDDPGIMLAEQVTADDRRDRRFRSELGVDLGAGGGVRQAVDIEIGSMTATDHQASLPVRWQASGRDRLFPVFDGEIELAPAGPGTTRVVVTGIYTVPLGPVGRFGDGLIGRRLARQSFVSFLDGAARRLDAEVHRRTSSLSWHPAPYPVDLREVGAEG